PEVWTTTRGAPGRRAPVVRAPATMTVLGVVLGAALLLAACAPATSAPSAPSNPAPPGGASPAAAWEQQWADLVAAAKREGEATIYGPPGRDFREALVGPFERAYPGIKVTFTAGSGSDLGPRILAERQAGRFIPDLFIGGTTTMNDTLKPAGALDSL